MDSREPRWSDTRDGKVFTARAWGADRVTVRRSPHQVFNVDVVALRVLLDRRRIGRANSVGVFEGYARQTRSHSTITVYVGLPPSPRVQATLK
jgi:hypothetical protein